MNSEEMSTQIFNVSLTVASKQKRQCLLFANKTEWLNSSTHSAECCPGDHSLGHRFDSKLIYIPHTFLPIFLLPNVLPNVYLDLAQNHRHNVVADAGHLLRVCLQLPQGTGEHTALL